MRIVEFLLSRNVVSKYDIASALQRQRSEQQPLGRVAIRHNYLSINQVFELLRVQADNQEARDLFGGLAIEFGFLDEEQLEEILKLQADTRPDILDVLVKANVLTVKQLHDEKAAFEDLAPELRS